MEKSILDEQFHKPTLDGRLQWLNPPPAWGVESEALVVQPAAKTDFWQQTHYGFRADNGHFLHLEVSGDFTVTTQVRFHPAHQYDQAGLMVRVGPLCWIKTAVEYESEGPAKLGAVVTNHSRSDWSLQNFPRGRNEVRLRISREGQDFMVEWSPDASDSWELLRLTHLHEGNGQPVQCGLYACSPKSAGFRAEFKFLQVAHSSAPVGPGAP
jgi:regulation of enolase protein 1 (concanavalin A-like superfamily)